MTFASELQGWNSHKALVAVQDFEICLLETIKKCLVQRIKSDKEYANALSTIVSMAQKQDSLYEHNTPFCQVNQLLCTSSSHSLCHCLVLQTIFFRLGTQNIYLLFCSLKLCSNIGWVDGLSVVQCVDLMLSSICQSAGMEQSPVLWHLLIANCHRQMTSVQNVIWPFCKWKISCSSFRIFTMIIIMKMSFIFSRETLDMCSSVWTQLNRLSYSSAYQVDAEKHQVAHVIDH